jgi:hypothetical protein
MWGKRVPVTLSVPLGANSARPELDSGLSKARQSRRGNVRRDARNSVSPAWSKSRVRAHGYEYGAMATGRPVIDWETIPEVDLEEACRLAGLDYDDVGVRAGALALPWQGHAAGTLVLSEPVAPGNRFAIIDGTFAEVDEPAYATAGAGRKTSRAAS